MIIILFERKQQYASFYFLLKTYIHDYEAIFLEMCVFLSLNYTTTSQSTKTPRTMTRIIHDYV